MGASEHLHLVERLTRVSPDGITYNVTIDDPDTFPDTLTAARLADVQTAAAMLRLS